VPILSAARWLSARGEIEFLCTQGLWKLEVTLIFGTAARYRRAKAGSSHDGAHPVSSALHTGAVRPSTAFAENLLFKAPRKGYFSKCSTCYQLMVYLWACTDLADGNPAKFSSGLMGFPSGDNKGTSSIGWLFWNLKAYPFLSEGYSISSSRWL